MKQRRDSMEINWFVYKGADVHSVKAAGLSTRGFVMRDVRFERLWRDHNPLGVF